MAQKNVSRKAFIVEDIVFDKNAPLMGDAVAFFYRLRMRWQEAASPVVGAPLPPRVSMAAASPRVLRGFSWVVMVPWRC